MPLLVLIRHGESIWNRADIFTGWTDVDLSERGIEEARTAGQWLAAEAFQFDVCHTSFLKRAVRTLWVVLEAMDQMWLTVHASWRLNERHYGALQGLNKTETAARFGAAQVFEWRRSFDTRPPALERSDPRFPGHDPRYRHLDPKDLPTTESLADTIRRVLPYWHENVAPQLTQGLNVLIAAHGNSLRALVKYLEDISDDKIPKVEIGTGAPLIYRFDDALRIIEKREAPVRR